MLLLIVHICVLELKMRYLTFKLQMLDAVQRFIDWRFGRGYIVDAEVIDDQLTLPLD